MAIVALLAIIWAVITLSNRGQGGSESLTTEQSTELAANETPAGTTSQVPVVVASTPTGDSTSDPTGDADAVTITYGQNGYSPASVTIKAGTTVNFVNGGGGGMWTASDDHPAHTKLPGFDARRNYTNGQIYSYTFTQVGSWRYHNHLNASDSGTVIVQ